MFAVVHRALPNLAIWNCWYWSLVDSISGSSTPQCYWRTRQNRTQRNEIGKLQWNVKLLPGWHFFPTVSFHIAGIKCQLLKGLKQRTPGLIGVVTILKVFLISKCSAQKIHYISQKNILISLNFLAPYNISKTKNNLKHSYAIANRINAAMNPFNDLMNCLRTCSVLKTQLNTSNRLWKFYDSSKVSVRAQ